MHFYYCKVELSVQHLKLEFGDNGRHLPILGDKQLGARIDWVASVSFDRAGRAARPGRKPQRTAMVMNTGK
jgi:hypothetical protein